jgi:hypothetical protein
MSNNNNIGLDVYLQQKKLSSGTGADKTADITLQKVTKSLSFYLVKNSPHF